MNEVHLQIEDCQVKDAEELAKENEAELLRYGAIFYELLQRPHFKEYLEINYDIRTVIDHETKTIYDQILEVPFEIKAQRIAELEKKIRDAGPQIVTPTAADVVSFNKGSR